MTVIEPDDKQFKELLDYLKLEYPRLAAKMSSNLVGNIASQGRKAEMRTANKLQMGQMQIKPKNNIPRPAKQYSKWDTDVGWVSTSRMAGNGKSGFRMGSFAWERASRHKRTSTAAYSNMLANLWGHETKPYSSKSPLVGRPGTGPFGEGKSWKAGEVRDARYQWSTVIGSMRTAVTTSIARTEDKFKERLENIKK